MLTIASVALLMTSELLSETRRYELNLNLAIEICVQLAEPQSERKRSLLESAHRRAVSTFRSLEGVEFLEGYRSDSLSTFQQTCLRQLRVEASTGNGT